jgi:hypothetical protein
MVSKVFANLCKCLYLLRRDSSFQALEMREMATAPFENVKNQIGFCGIWCGSCSGGNGSIIELTRRYEETVKENNLEKWAPKGFDSKEFMKGLALIQTTSSCPGCRKGGGNPSCRIRICALKKNLDDCSQCDGLIACRDFEELERSIPKIKEDLMKIRNMNRKEVIEKWMVELLKKWPHCVLFCSSPKK